MSEREKEMTVGELRAKLAGIDDAMPVIVEVFDEDGPVDQLIGGLASVDVECRCADTPSLFLSGDVNVGGERDEDDEAPASDDNLGGFGREPEDSARLLEIYNLVDEVIGWQSVRQREGGDYLSRLKEVAEELDAFRNVRSAAAMALGSATGDDLTFISPVARQALNEALRQSPAYPKLTVTDEEPEG